MIIKRPWAKDIEVDDRWDIPCGITRHRIYIYWAHPELMPCDGMGIRIPTGFSSFKEKYERSRDQQRIFCFGGSTTMGVFCDYADSYPHHLEKLLGNAAVFNFGLGGCDLKYSMYLLIDLLRWGYLPDLIIFLDGINEKQGWFQSLNGYKSYQETSCQYGYFSTLIKEHRPHMTFDWKKQQSFISKIKKFVSKMKESKKRPETPGNPFRFVSEQAQYYIMTKEIIRKLAQGWNIKTKFLLQPVLWDTWKQATDNRHTYLKMLYKDITKGCPEVSDLSEKVSLDPSEFIDWQHLIPSGNKALAEAIAQEVAVFDQEVKV